jgi:transposase
MHEIPTISTERVDDIPLLLPQMQQMELPPLIDTHFPAHGNWYGLSLGWVSTRWLRAILSRGAHRLGHVEPWGAHRRFTLQTVTGQDVERLDFTDERRESVLRRLRDDARWAQFDSRLNPHPGRVYSLPPERLHVASTTARAYTRVSPAGLFPFGPSKDYRPGLPQVQRMQAVREPLGRPLATDVGSGERAADPLYSPGSERVPHRVGRRGLLCVGACKMAAPATRAFIALAGDYSLCPLPQGATGRGRTRCGPREDVER